MNGNKREFIDCPVCNTEFERPYLSSGNAYDNVCSQRCFLVYKAESQDVPKRVTRDMKYYSVKDMSEAGYELQWNSICDYIEYLEANQKDNK